MVAGYGDERRYCRWMQSHSYWCSKSITVCQPKKKLPSTHNSSVFIPSVDRLRQWQHCGDGSLRIGSGHVQMIHTLDVLKNKPAVRDGFVPDLHQVSVGIW